MTDTTKTLQELETLCDVKRKAPAFTPQGRRRERIITALASLHFARFDVGDGPFEDDGVDSCMMNLLRELKCLTAVVPYNASERAIIILQTGAIRPNELEQHGLPSALSDVWWAGGVFHELQAGRPGWRGATGSRKPYGAQCLYRDIMRGDGRNLEGRALYEAIVCRSWLQEAAKRAEQCERWGAKLAQQGWGING